METPPIFLACETGNMTLLEESLKTYPVDMKSTNESYTPLMVASNHCFLDLLNKLLDSGASINAQSDGGMTPLMLAINPNEPTSVQVVQTLIDRGADVNLSTGIGNTVLMEAANQGNLEIVQILLKAGADVNAKTQYNDTALSAGSLSRGNPEVIKALIEAGADIHTRDVDNMTALDLARKYKNGPVTTLLVSSAHKERVALELS